MSRNTTVCGSSDFPCQGIFYRLEPIYHQSGNALHRALRGARRPMAACVPIRKLKIGKEDKWRTAFTVVDPPDF